MVVDIKVQNQKLGNNQSETGAGMNYQNQIPAGGLTISPGLLKTAQWGLITEWEKIATSIYTSEYVQRPIKSKQHTNPKTSTTG